jgi:hypothetical protein
LILWKSLFTTARPREALALLSPPAVEPQKQ